MQRQVDMERMQGGGVGLRVFILDVKFQEWNWGHAGGEERYGNCHFIRQDAPGGA